MFAVIQVKDSLPMRDGLIANLPKTAQSHMESRIFFFCRILLLVINSLGKQVLDFCFFFFFFSLPDLLCNRMVI